MGTRLKLSISSCSMHANTSLCSRNSIKSILLLLLLLLLLLYNCYLYTLQESSGKPTCVAAHMIIALSPFHPAPPGHRWGLWNPSPSTISHCKCDNQFRACLKRVGNAPAKATGLAYFVELGLNCFRFRIRRVCVQRYWFGLCRRYGNRRITIAYRNNWF